MKTGLVNLAGVTLICSSAILVAACGSSGGGSLATPACDTTGNWYTVSYVTTNDPYVCSDSNGVYQESWPTLRQSGNNLTVTVGGNSYTGTISGSTISWSGSYLDTGGTTTETLNATVNAACNVIEGTTSWSWSDGYYSCTGSAVVYSVRW